MIPIALRRAWFALILISACQEANEPTPGPADAGTQWNGATDAELLSPLLDGAQGTVADAAPSDDASSEAAGPLVELSIGRLEGTLVGTTRALLGIPYAKAPVGELRFAPPQAVAAWTGTRPAKAFGAACPQKGETGVIYGLPALPQSEDCLFLNVYAPAQPSDKARPVMVWIHGGSGISGSGAEYDGRKLSEVGDVIVVTINYRLGALASLALPELDTALGTTAGNLAPRDQQFALRWVHDHIAAFGGDPKNVTLFGQSAGAIGACMHMFIESSRELVTRFILQSGGCLGSAVNPGTRAQTEAASRDLTTALCANRMDVVACLRALTPKQLLDYKSTRSNVLEQIGALHVDGKLLTAHPKMLAKEGKFHPGPVLVGSTRDEARFLAAPEYGQTWPMVKNGLEYGIAVPAMYPEIAFDLLAHYGLPSDATANDTLVDLMNDGWFVCPARALARAVAARGGQAYLYSFDIAPAVHTQEIDYVFGFEDARISHIFKGASVPPHAALTRAIQDYWLSFARTGAPSAQGLPVWPKYSAEADLHLVLDATITTKSGLEKADCDFWNDALLAP